MNAFLLFYEKAPGYAERQQPFAAAHLAYLDTLVIGGHLILAGSLENPIDGSALLFFHADSTATVEAFAQADPYVLHGIVNHWTVRKWDTVIGTALHP